MNQGKSSENSDKNTNGSKSNCPEDCWDCRWIKLVRNVVQFFFSWRFFAIAAILTSIFYAVLVYVMVTSTFAQSIIVYLNNVHIPYWDLGDLMYYGLPQGRNIEIKTEDGLILRGWHLLPAGDDSIQSAMIPESDREMYFDEKIRIAKRIIVYFHGNADNRAFPYRIDFIRHITAQYDAHVISFDYRGFGDSEGWPSEEGTVLDGKAVVQWIHDRVTSDHPYRRGYVPSNSSDICLENGTVAAQPHLFLYGHSLGSGISVALAHEFSKFPEIKLSGIVLDCPFTDLPEASLSHPAGAIFRIFPITRDWIKKYLKIVYPSIQRIGSLRIPVLIFHGEKDMKIPPEHSKILYEEAIRSRDRSNFTNDVRYFEVPRADHGNVFHSPLWLKEMFFFIRDSEKWVDELFSNKC